MKRVLLAWIALTSGCERSNAERRATSPQHDSAVVQQQDTPSSAVTQQQDVPCEPTANAQVFVCTIELPAPDVVTLTLTAPGAPTRSFRSSQTKRLHVFYVWGLLPETVYDWEAGSASGQLTTGSLPSELSGLTVAAEGSLFGMDAVLVYVPCGWFVMLDASGRVVWHQDSGLYDYIADGMRWSQEEKAMLTLRDAAFTLGNTSGVLMRDVAGHELLYLDSDALSLRSTHDLDVWNGYLYVLGNEPRGFHFSLGGVEIFDGTQRVATWMVSEAFPDVEDLENDHLNTLSVNAGGEMTLSMYSRTAVLGIDGDPSSPSFLQLRYHALGSMTQPNPLPEPDFVAASETLFRAPHNPNRVGDTLWVFDNASRSVSRAVQMSMNADGTLSEVHAYSAFAECPHQSGAIPVEGGVLVTCSATNGVYLYREGATEPEWTLQATCDASARSYGSVRAYPVTVE